VVRLKAAGGGTRKAKENVVTRKISLKLVSGKQASLSKLIDTPPDNNKVENISQTDSNPVQKNGHSNVGEEVNSIVRKSLHLESDDLDPEISFSDLGMDSIGSVEIVHTINSALGTNIDVSALYDYPNLSSLTTYLEQQSGFPIYDVETNASTQAHSEQSTSEVGCRTSEDGDLDSYEGGVDVISILRDIVSNILHLDIVDCATDIGLSELGVDSIGSVEIARDISARFSLHIDVSEIYNYPSINELASYLGPQLGEVKNVDDSDIRDFVDQLSDQDVSRLLEEHLSDDEITPAALTEI